MTALIPDWASRACYTGRSEHPRDAEITDGLGNVLRELESGLLCLYAALQNDETSAVDAAPLALHLSGTAREAMQFLELWHGGQRKTRLESVPGEPS